MSYLKIEWLNSVDFGSVLYQDGFKNRIYLDVELERPDYNVTFESDTNGDNQEIPKFKKWEKVYKFTVWMQEDLVDAFTFMSVCDTIEVTPQTGETLIVQEGSMRVEPEWEDAGCLAKTTVSFVTDYAAGGSCTENMDKICLCVNDQDVDYIIEYSTIGGITIIDGTYVLGWTVQHIVDTKFTAKLYTANEVKNSWDEVVVESGYCVSGEGEHYIYDGTYWQLMPGYIISTSYAAPNLTILGWAPDGTFVTVWIDNGPGGAWVDYGDYISQDLETGIDVPIGTSGSFHLKLEIWNHTCNYGYTDTVDIIIP